MKLARISAVVAFGALAACAGEPAETLVASYGDAMPPTVSQPATSNDEPAQESASAAIGEARAAAAGVEAEGEKPGPGALAFSPAQGAGEPAAADVPASEDQSARIAALPKQESKPAAETPLDLLKQDPVPASEEDAVLSKPDPEPAPEDTGTPAESAARTPEQPVAQALALAPGQSYGVQLAAYRQPGGAEAAWKVLLGAYPDLLAELSKTIRRADLGATRGVVHQLRVGPFAGEAEARALCEILKKRGADCFVVAPRRSRRP